jgi:hypothetical protein
VETTRQLEANCNTNPLPHFLPTTTTPAMAHGSSHGQVHFFQLCTATRTALTSRCLVGCACIFHALKETLTIISGSTLSAWRKTKLSDDKVTMSQHPVIELHLIPSAPHALVSTNM